MISNCGGDEYGGIHGGAAGDQTGREWQLVGWYSYPWNVMLRYPDEKIRHWMGDQATAAAKNNLIGYDQWQRLTFWQNLADSNYDAAQITVKCEADCSSGVLAIAKAAGYHFGIPALQAINQNGYTGNEEAILKAAGFEVHRESKYLTSGSYLDNGDILLNTQCHTAFNVTRGAYCDAPTQSTTPATKEPGPCGTVTYIVQPGDILFNIAKKYGVDYKQLASDNNLANPNLIYPGQKLIVKNPKENKPIEYIVQPGDTLSGIATKYGVPYQQIAEDNGIVDPNIISVGQKIIIKR